MTAHGAVHGERGVARAGLERVLKAGPRAVATSAGRRGGGTAMSGALPSGAWAGISRSSLKDRPPRTAGSPLVL